MVYFLQFVKIIHLGCWYFGGYLFIFYFFISKIVFKSTLKVGEGIFSSNLSYGPLFRFLVFWGDFLCVCVCFFFGLFEFSK